MDKYQIQYRYQFRRGQLPVSWVEIGLSTVTSPRGNSYGTYVYSYVTRVPSLCQSDDAFAAQLQATGRLGKNRRSASLGSGLGCSGLWFAVTKGGPFVLNS